MKKDTSHHIVPPGSTIGIIGGGQLGRMTALAAANLGYKVHIYTPEQNSPASQVSYATTVASYTDMEALKSFAIAVDVVTFEFENIPHESVKTLSSLVETCPGWQALHISQNRIREKDFINKLGIGTARYKSVASVEELREALSALGVPAILKTVELGYDGKGQYVIRPDTNLEALWEQAHKAEIASHVDWVLEAFVPFEKEISVVIARGKDGVSLAYPPSENMHKNGILATSTVPAAIDTKIAELAQSYAQKIADALNFVGILAVEFFLEKEGRLLVNEIAPRPHNSGHWTMDACVTSQFEQQVRAVCGLPLGAVALYSSVVMENLIGEEINDWQRHIADIYTKIHIYGKKEARAGRKMGHINRLIPSRDS